MSTPISPCCDELPPRFFFPFALSGAQQTLTLGEGSVSAPPIRKERKMTVDEFSESKAALGKALDDAQELANEFLRLLPVGTPAISRCANLIWDAKQQLRLIECPFA